MGLFKKIINNRKEEESFHNLKTETRIKNSIKYKTIIIISFILLMDGGLSIGNYYRDKINEYETKIEKYENLALEQKENEVLYQETLFSIVKELYGREQFMTGGVEVPTEVSLEVLVGAIKNTTQNFKEVIEATENYFDKREQIMAEIPCIWPLEHSPLIRITSGFGFRFSPITGKFMFHPGLDITGGEIDPKSRKYTAPKVIATANGRIKIHYMPPGWHNGTYYKGYIDEDGDDYGAYVVIEHGIFDNERKFIANGYETRYAHMEGTFEFIKEGEEIHQGDPLGYMGGTGNTTGLHVHYELRKDGVAVNPIDYLISMFSDNGKVVDLN